MESSRPMVQETIPKIVQSAIENYIHGTTKIGDYVSWSMHDTIERITAYLNSKHISGDKDSLGRDKPFFNIVVAAANIWFRATDIDRKDIRIRETRQSDIFLTFFANALLQDWMRRERFGVFLNQWGLALAQYGSAVVKFVKKDGRLVPSIVPWNRVVCDPVDFEALPRIEKIYKTPAQLRKMAELDQTVVENLITAINTRKTLSGNQKDNQSEFIELFEVHGELSVATYKAAKKIDIKDGDDKEYRQQVHLISYQKNKDDGLDEYTLYCGYEEQDPYLLTHLLEQDGRTLAIGAVEYLFDAQWMQNHTMKNLKDTLDISSKLLFQTADANYHGRNILSAIETGDILTHAENRPLTQINNSKADVTALQNFSMQWSRLAQELTATPESLRGITPPSGTPYSTTALLTQQAGSLFDKMTQNKGLALEDMLRKFIIPYLKTKMDTSEEIMALMQEQDIKRIDAMYVPNEAIRRYNTRAKENILNLEIPAPFNKTTEEQIVKQELAPLGNQRALSPGDITWREALKDLEWDSEVLITNESTDKNVVATTLTQALQLILNPNYEQNPTAKMIVGKILSLVGAVSPVEMPATQTPPVVPMPAITPVG